MEPKGTAVKGTEISREAWDVVPDAGLRVRSLMDEGLTI